MKYGSKSPLPRKEYFETVLSRPRSSASTCSSRDGPGRGGIRAMSLKDQSPGANIHFPQSPKRKPGPWTRLGSYLRSIFYQVLGPAGRIRAPQDEPGPRRTGQDPQDESGPRKTDQDPQDESGLTERSRAPQYESGPRGTDQGPEGRIRSPEGKIVYLSVGPRAEFPLPTVSGADAPPALRFAPATLCFATPTFVRFSDFLDLKRQCLISGAAPRLSASGGKISYLPISFTACSPNFSGGNNIVLLPQPHLSGGKLPPLPYGGDAHVSSLPCKSAKLSQL